MNDPSPIVHDPVVLPLDKATSWLDSKSERLVQEALDELMEGRTSIFIAHRLATVRRADRIVVIKHGGVYRTLSELRFDLNEV